MPLTDGSVLVQPNRHLIRWDAAILELVPQRCQRCEGKVEAIRVFYDETAEVVYVTCGKCRFLLARAALGVVEMIKREQKLDKIRMRRMSWH